MSPQEYNARTKWQNSTVTIAATDDLVIAARPGRVFFGLYAQAVGISVGMCPGHPGPLTQGRQLISQNELFFHEWGGLVGVEWRAIVSGLGGPTTFDLIEAWVE